jgi:selenocysteine lyase/cysteine desulfurase
LLNGRTRLLAVSQMSNVTGGCPDIAQAIQLGWAVHHALRAIHHHFGTDRMRQLNGLSDIGAAAGNVACGARVVKWPLGADRLPDIARLPALLNGRTRLLDIGAAAGNVGHLTHRQQAGTAVQQRRQPGDIR